MAVTTLDQFVALLTQALDQSGPESCTIDLVAEVLEATEFAELAPRLREHATQDIALALLEHGASLWRQGDYGGFVSLMNRLGIHTLVECNEVEDGSPAAVPADGNYAVYVYDADQKEIDRSLIRSTSEDDVLRQAFELAYGNPAAASWSFAPVRLDRWLELYVGRYYDHGRPGDWWIESVPVPAHLSEEAALTRARQIMQERLAQTDHLIAFVDLHHYPGDDDVEARWDADAEDEGAPLSIVRDWPGGPCWMPWLAVWRQQGDDMACPVCNRQQIKTQDRQTVCLRCGWSVINPLSA